MVLQEAASELSSVDAELSADRLHVVGAVQEMVRGFFRAA